MQHLCCPKLVDVIVINIPIQNFRISKVKVIQHLLGGDVGLSNVFVLEVFNADFVNSGDEKGLEGLVRHVILGIKSQVGVIFPVSV